ncbi:MAG: nuclear transport factor 2 family protein [Beijerinckiaceae bacterium]
MTDNSVRVRSLFESFGSGDLKSILDHLDPSIEWISSTSARAIPWRGRHSGVDGAAYFFKALTDNLDFEVFEPRQFFAAGDNVTVLGRTLARVKGTGKKFDSEWAHVFTFKSGKVARFQEFYDTAAIVNAIAG